MGENACVSVCATDGKELFIGKAVQKAYLEVTEEGAEGAVGSGAPHRPSPHLSKVCFTQKNEWDLIVPSSPLCFQE